MQRLARKLSQFVDRDRGVARGELTVRSTQDAYSYDFFEFLKDVLDREWVNWKCWRLTVANQSLKEWITILSICDYPAMLLKIRILAECDVTCLGMGKEKDLIFSSPLITEHNRALKQLVNNKRVTSWELARLMCLGCSVPPERGKSDVTRCHSFACSEFL